MGIVAKQTTKNILIIGIAFTIGGLNTLVLYPLFLSAEEYGLVVFLLATSNLLMPLIGFGVHQTIIRFFSSYGTKKEQPLFLSSERRRNRSGSSSPGASGPVAVLRGGARQEPRRSGRGPVMYA